MGRKIFELSSSFMKLFKNVSIVLELSWKHEKYILIMSIMVAISVSVLPFFGSGAVALLINNLVDVVRDNSTLSVGIIILVILSFIMPKIVFVVQQYIDRQYYLRMSKHHELALLRKLADLDMATHGNKTFTDLRHKATQQSMFPLLHLGRDSFGIIASLVSVVFASVVLISFDWRLFALTIVATLPSLVIEVKYGRGVWHIFDSNSEKMRLVESFRNHFFCRHDLIELKVYQNVDYFYKQIKQLNDEFVNEQ